MLQSYTPVVLIKMYKEIYKLGKRIVITSIHENNKNDIDKGSIGNFLVRRIPLSFSNERENYNF